MREELGVYVKRIVLFWARGRENARKDVSRPGVGRRMDVKERVRPFKFIFTHDSRRNRVVGRVKR